jgi:hypothetical protein
MTLGQSREYPPHTTCGHAHTTLGHAGWAVPTVELTLGDTHEYAVPRSTEPYGMSLHRARWRGRCHALRYLGHEGD